MTTYILFLLLGLGSGAIYATLALGVLLAYRGSGVINFAHGAMAGYIAYVFLALRNDGDLFLPPIPNPLAILEWFVDRIPGSSWDPEFWEIPTTISFGADMSFFPAFIISMLFAALLGYALHSLVFKPLRYAPVLAKVVSSVGIMLLLQGILVIRFETRARSVPQALYDDPITIFDAKVPADRFVLTALVLVVTLVLWAVYRFTSFGLKTRASAENEKGAVLTGINPDRQAGINWILSSMLAGAAGILVAPITGLSPTGFTLFIVPALGAALLGRFTSFSITAFAGLMIGMIQSELTLIQTKANGWGVGWLKNLGLRDAFPFVVIVVALFIGGQSLPTRGAISEALLPGAPKPKHVMRVTAILVPIAAAGLIWAPFDVRGSIINTMVGFVITLSLVVLVGFVGQISLAQMTLAGIAGFTLSRIAENTGIPFPIAPILAALVAAAFGLLIAVPAIRIRGVNLAVVTLATAVAIEELLFRNRDFVGAEGAPVPAPSLFGIDMGQGADFFLGDDKLPSPIFGLLLLVMTVSLALFVAALRLGSTGRHMLAVRSNERAAASTGISVTGVKLMAFGLAAFIAGLGGTMTGYRFESITAASFAILLSISVLAFAYLGGITSMSGAMAGALLSPGAIMFFVSDKIWSAGDYQVIFGGFGLIITAILNPEGISGAIRQQHRDRQEAKAVKAAEAAGTSTAPVRAESDFDDSVVETIVYDRRPGGEPVLTTQDLTVSFSGLKAVDSVDLVVPRGQLVGLIGPNGAGKTTIVDALTGYVPSTGSITFLGKRIDGLQAHERINSGVARTWQSVDLFADLTVRENLQVAMEELNPRTIWNDIVHPNSSALDEEVNKILDIFDLRPYAEELPAELPLGRQKLAGVARALATGPDLLILDEPAAGLDNKESILFGQTLHDLVSDDLTVLLIDHDMSLVMNICDSINVLDFGQIIATGLPEDVRDDDAVITAYLGERGRKERDARAAGEGVTA